MIATAKTRMVLPLIALAAAGGAGLVVAGRQIQQDRPVEIQAATVNPQPSSPSPSSSAAADQRTAALDTARSAASDLAGALSGLPAAADKGDGVPSFDVARLEPTGEAVIAGRAAPGATVELLRDGERHDSVIADQSGQFAMIPRPLPPGNYHLTLRMRLPDGTVAMSRQTLAVALDPTAKDGVMVALVAPDKPTVVLSPTAPAATVAVEAVDIEPNGKIHVSGRASPGATVRVYVSDGLAASLTAGADGRVSGTLNEPVKPGRHLVRLDQVEQGSGKVLARAEVPLNVPDTVTTASITPEIGAAKLPDAAPKRAPQLAAATPMLPAGTLSSSSAAPKAGTVTVSRGDNLWRISRRALGGGERYAIIYKANREQIRNPNLIYPGQVFVLPQR